MIKVSYFRLILLVNSLFLTKICFGSEIGFIEKFSLAPDRSTQLKELIPGTEDYYYFHALNYQNNNQLNEVESTLKPWIKRYGYTARVEEIRNRQALLMYETDPQYSLKFLKDKLKLYFNHQKIIPDKKPTHLTVLDQNIISRKALSEKAFKKHKGLQGFEDSALDFLVVEDINMQRRRELLRRLKRPDYPVLPEMVVADLKYKHSSGFGSHEIHNLLLIDQLKRCAELMPDLLNNSNFVNAMLTKLRPNSEVNIQYDANEKDTYLNRLWAFVKPLSKSFNSLKAHVLYNRLIFDESQGVYNKQLFMEYIKLPKEVFYINRKFKKQWRYRQIADLNQDYTSLTVFPPIRTDEALVKRYLEHFFVKMDSIADFAPYIDNTFLKESFAETKIVNGLGDMEEWYSMLTPAKYKVLKERVDIEFAPRNKTLFRAGQDVALDIFIKNVKKLIVKIYHVNTLNYYRTAIRQVGLDMDLDGLVANEESVYKYEESPLRKIKRHFTFPSLKDAGVYIIEFVGNGKSSRTIIKKGQLKYVENSTSSGHIFTLFDEDNQKILDGSIILAGHEYKADKDGRVNVPFTNKPGRQPIILVHNDFSALDYFEHASENYQLEAGIYVDRETLLKNRKSNVIIRPVLYLNNDPVTISLLEDISLIIESQDHEGTRSVKEVADFKLYEDRESVFEFQTPENLSKIKFRLKAKVQNLSLNEKIELFTERRFELNTIDTFEEIYDMHLGCIDNEYVIDLLGRNGEPYSSRPVTIELKHKDFREHVIQFLQTDNNGRINLGPLKDIISVSANLQGVKAHRWMLTHDNHNYPLSLHALEGETIKIPYMGKAKKARRDNFSLLEKRGNSYYKDWYDHIVINNGFVEIRSLPAGEYDFLIKESNTNITLRLAKGKLQESHFLSNHRCIEQRNQNPLQINRVNVDNTKIKIHLANDSGFARVHVVATSFVPDYSIFSLMGDLYFPEPRVIDIFPAKSLYHSGRNIGDEVSYILNRKYAKKFPGNMLKRPKLLLNPMSLQKTETKKDAGGYGDDQRGYKAAAQRAISEPQAVKSPEMEVKSIANLDFLANTSIHFTNLRPDSNSIITLDMKMFAKHSNIHILAVDPLNTAYRKVSILADKIELNDLRLTNALDSKKHYTEQKQISFVDKGQDFTISDITTSKFELYDTIGKVYRLYATLASDEKLAEFNFILEWSKLDHQSKLEKYSKYACHELNFFIYKKDKDFFDKIIAPYLQNKKDKTFLDHWLLKDDLTQYLNPWPFNRLNIVEKILLGQRITNEHPIMLDYINDLFDTIPHDLEKFNFNFNIALSRSTLDAGDVFGVEKAKGLILGKLAADFRETGGAIEEVMSLQAGVASRRRESITKTEELKRSSVKTGLSFEDISKGKPASYFDRDALKKRKKIRQLYRKLDKTREWVENNYYHLPLELQNAFLVTINAFWKDYAQHKGDDVPFYSTHLAEAAGLPEMMLAMSVLDLPFEKAIHETKIEGSEFTLRAKNPMIVFHEEIRKAEIDPDKIPVIVSQNFFKHGERYQYVGREQHDKYVTDNFIVSTVYGCNVIVTNSSSLPQKLNILLQIPKGALPVKNGFYTRGVSLELQPYATESLDYYFYFPNAGDFPHYPCHVSKDEKIVAYAGAVTFHVTEKPLSTDLESWDYISQEASNDEVLEYLNSHNLNRINLDKIAFRMRNKDFFKRVIEFLNVRHFYNNTLWSYSIYHNVLNAIRHYLQNSPFLNECGLYIDTGLATIDPVERQSYKHMEYNPLVNPRVHLFGKKRKILNDRFYEQYHNFMKVLSYKQRPDHGDLTAITYAMLLQDRIDEAFTFFRQINPEKIHTELQYEYLKTYLAFYSQDFETARSIASQYVDYPVIRWKNLFINALNQLGEIEGSTPKIVDTEDRTQIQTTLAATEPILEFKVEAKQVTINYKNITQCVVNYYLMDIELLFSRNPFVRHYSNQFSHIQPNHKKKISLTSDKSSYLFNLPEKFNNSNIMIEIVSGAIRKAQAYFSHTLNVQLIENYGHVMVSSSRAGQPLSGVYVKVYAKLNNEEILFYKDGYTDLRGRFDYSSLNTNELRQVKTFSLLIMSDTDGSVIREALPPKM